MVGVLKSTLLIGMENSDRRQSPFPVVLPHRQMLPCLAAHFLVFPKFRHRKRLDALQRGP
jgi:hypothetical protein